MNSARSRRPTIYYLLVGVVDLVAPAAVMRREMVRFKKRVLFKKRMWVCQRASTPPLGAS
jgi:hypothetical protein